MLLFNEYIIKIFWEHKGKIINNIIWIKIDEINIFNIQSVLTKSDIDILQPIITDVLW